MLRLEARVTSVQIITGFPAHMIIPEPPGWRPVCSTNTGISRGVTTRETCTPSGTLGERGGTPYAVRSAINEQQAVKIEQNTGHILGFGDATATDLTSSTEYSMSISQTRESSMRAIHCVEPATNQLENDPYTLADTEIGIFKFNKLKGEDLYLNFLVHRGPWIDQPPSFLKFDSCKNGPTLYVNDVIGKNVCQIWQRTVDGWVPVKEGHTIFAGRERTLRLDKHQTPHLWAVRRKPQISRVDDDSQ